MHDAEAIYQETEHSTAPIAAAAMGAAVAAVAAESTRSSRSDKRRDERRSGRTSDYDERDSKSRGREREPERDPIQEEADRAYREIVMARKIASQVIRSRSASPDPSVVRKYDEKDEEEIIRIVTPPGMEDHKKKGPYDAPNADFRPDYEIKDPRDLRNFSLPSISVDRSNPESGLKRDPDATKPRPLLNLVYPTPTPSPLPEKQAARSESKRSSKSRDRDDSSRSETARSEPARSSKTRDREETSKSDTGRSPKSKDREDPTRSEAAWSEPGRSSKSRDNDESTRSETAWSEPVRSSKAKDREEKIRSAASEGYSSPTTSTVSKGVTWGQNETKHFEVESPSEHKDEFISSTDVKARETPSEPKSPAKSKSGGWGAIAAGIMGAGAGAAAASSSDTSKKSKENEKKQEEPYEYRGVVVEPESPPRRRSPPSTGPKPSTTGSSRVPGAFNDDLDFTATVAAGLQDTGFDPNIVINDPSFRRRDSPPGSNEPNIYRTPYAETVSDLGTIPPNASAVSRSSQSFVMGDVASTPQEWRSVSPDGDEFSTKLSKKEQKKRDKAAKRQSGEIATFEETPTPKAEESEAYFEPKLSKKEQKKRDKEAKRQSSLAEDITPTPEPSVSREFVEEPESYFEPAKKSKKSKRDSTNFDDLEETSSPDASRDGRKVSVPVDAFDDLRNEEDEWATPKSKKKSKRDSDRYDSPARSVPSEVGSELERSSSKKSKDKSKRKSVDQYEPDPAEVSLPPSTPSETSRDGDYEDRKSKKSSSRDSGIFDNDGRGNSRSVVSGRYDDEPRKSKKKSRSGTKDDFDDTRSVASAPAGDDFEDSKKSKKDKRSSGSFFGLFGSKSESGARDDSPKRSKDDFDDIKKKKKSKRSSVPDASSLYGDLGATSVNDLSRSVSNGYGSSRYDDDLDSGFRSDGERRKTRSRAESASSKKDSFLGKAGTLGAGVGIAGAAVAIAAHHHQQSKADHAYDESEHRRPSRSGERARKENVFDYEIKQREFRPSIDPQYGDLLPLPPSDPASPNVESLEDLPDLPDSGPETPETERLLKERARNSARKSLQGTPAKPPSHSAVPLKFVMGNRSDRSTPSSPGLVRSSPSNSPATPSQESTIFSRPRHRPTSSWDSAREYKPLYLVESSRRSSQVQVAEEEAQLPELPPSQRTSRSSSQLDPDDEGKGFGLDDEGKGLGLGIEKPPSDEHTLTRQLSIDTGLASSTPSAELLDSQQSTPKAGIAHDLEERPRSPSGSAAKAIAAAGLVSTIGYFASSPSHRTAKENWLDDLPSVQRQPSPVDAMTKDRSSYLLQSSPMSRKDDLESEEQGVYSPLRQKSAIARDSLQSIEEQDGHDMLSKEADFQQDVPSEKVTLPQLPREPEQVDNETEPADEFAFTKSKKDRKKDKKKGTGLSRSSTQDDVSVPEPSVEPTTQVFAPGDIEPEEEFSTPESKKDKKKDKKKGKSVSSWQPEEEASTSQQPQEPVPEETREIVETLALVDVEPSELFSMPKSKKDKKKDKKKGKSLSSWEPEEDASTAQQFDEPVTESSREIFPEPAVQGDIEPSEEFSTPKSKKEPKRDKKGKAVSTWEPDEDVTPSQNVEEPLVETSREMPISEEPSTTFEAEPSEEFTMTSKKGKKKDKKNKSKSAWEPEEESILPQSEEPLPESSLDVPEETPTPAEADPFEESFSSKSKKNRKKDKKKGASSISFEPEQEEVEPSTAQEPILTDNNRDLVDEPAPVSDDFETPETKKSKKEKRKSKSWQPEEEAALPEQSFQDPQPEIEQDTSREAPATDGFESFSTKKSKKNKKGKSTTSWETEEETQITEESSREAKPEDEFRPISTPKEAEEVQEFVMPGSKKSKKKSRKSQSWEDDPEPQQPQVDTPVTETPVETESFVPMPTEEVDDFATPSSKIGKKKSRKSQAFDFAEEAQPESTEKEGDLAESEVAPEASSTKATPMGGPGSWETAPSTPWATAEESMTSPKAGYFPSTAALHSPEKRRISEDAHDKGYFPSPTTLLPVAVAGAAALAAHEGAKHLSRKDDHAPEYPDSKSSDFDNPQSERRDIQKPTPDGFAAGYKDDQLSLARQLQEEFSSGSSKKSKKDKKKRQSLPSTPDPGSSRSRHVDEPTDLHPRARSLSIGPSAEGDQRKSVYSEDQLELARQLKADFEKGSKKSKKDKKKRGESLDPSTRDNAFDQGAEEPTTQQGEFQDVPKSDNVDETPKGDGFAAGYQEDQLSLARQLQAEFGSGSKKSKKDKKRRSTSQTPQEQDPSNDDYFGASAQAPVSDTPYSEEPASIAELSPGNDATRDGLAVGYKEEQLEPTRQLKEEFGSGSKKSKKGKKDKKSQNLGRKDLDDGFSSSIPAGEPDESLGRDVPAPALETTEAGPSEPLNAEPEDEFAFVSKKSKKDKKGKKRDSLARNTTDDNLPSDAQESRDVDIAQPEVAPQAEPETVPPTDDFEFSTKKSKKDKKGKKRESLLRSTTDDNLSSDAPAKESEARDADVSQPDVQETSREPETAEPVDEFEFTTKKSKKDKKGKKRESLVQTPADEVPTPVVAAPEVTEPSAIESRDIDVSQPTWGQESPREPEIGVPADEFAFTTKKTKKDKKGKNRESFIPSAADAEVAPDQFGQAVEALHNARDLPSEEIVDAPSEPVAAIEEEWAVPGKKSKKDKKKRQSLAAQDEATAQPATEVDPVSTTEEPSTTVSSATEAVTEPLDDFGFTSKKSKKDKKKRQSLLRSSTFDDTPEPPTEETDLQIASGSQDVDVHKESEPVPAAEQDDGFEFTSKKSKKDKEKRQSMPEPSATEDVPRDLQEPTSIEESGTRDIESESQQQHSMPVDVPLVSAPEAENREPALDDATFGRPPLEIAAEVAPEEPESQFEEFSFSKKSKKDKKKRKDSSKPDSEEVSGISTPLDPLTETTNVPAEPSLPEETVQQKPSIVEELRKPKVDADGTGVWDAFSTKKSKKDKKKKKNDSKDTSGEPPAAPTPIDAVPKDIPESSLASDNAVEKAAVEEPRELQLDPEIPATEQDVIEEPEQDEWSSFSSGKTSKRDKKKRKSGLSTPIETIPEASGPIEEPVAEPSSSTPQEQFEAAPIAAEEPEQTSSVLNIVDEPEQDDWASASTKKSKKDKKKRKSGLSTPIETIPEAPGPIEEPIVEPPQSSSREQIDEARTVAEDPIQTSSVQHLVDEPEQDEWASTSTKKSKKDKRQSGFSTPVESVPESLGPTDDTVTESSSIAKQDDEVAITSEEPATSTSIQDVVPEPEQDEWSFSTKKSKKDKKKRKSGVSTPVEEEHHGSKALEAAGIIAAGAAITAVAANQFVAEPSKDEESPAPATIQDTTEEPAAEEWGSFSTKKSKKDKKKRKSGLSTPIEESLDKSGPSEDFVDAEKQSSSTPAEEIVEETKFDNLPASPSAHEIVEEPSKLEESFVPTAVQETEEPADEWSAFSTKKSKKDKKKRKSGLSTPVEEVQQPIETTESSTPAHGVVDEPAKPEEPAPIVDREAIVAASDDWAPLSRKQSKKDKKRKSGLSTPVEEVPEVIKDEPSSSATTREVFEEPAKTEESSTSAIPQDVPEERVDEWASYSTKKSKKDKKRKSGLSTPAEEVPEIAKDELSSSTATREVFEDPAKTEEPSAGAPVQDVTKEPVDEWAGYSTKKSKKDKKKRKSGVSTPVAETIAAPSKSLEFETSTEEPKAVEIQASDDFAQAASMKLDDGDRDAEDSGFGFVTKKSKKDKKGKRGSRNDSETDTTGFLQKDPPISVDDYNEPGPFTSENLIANPIDIEQRSPSLTDKIKDAPPTSSSPTSEHLKSEEMDTVTGDLSRTPSKKDKRKRQATVDANMPDYVGPTKAPLTSWADEVEEAEVERKLPVIEDIAKDESLSHIALTTESSPVDDFIRPTKKGKKGTKRNSGSIGSASMAEPFRPPIGEDAPKEHSEEHSNIPALAATGAAALAGAAILSKSGEKQSEPSTSASGSSTPVRKLSKKEKRKMSIDRRAPRDDMFDDPALWEGADPKEFEEESKGQDNDDNDGFWSAPQEDETRAELVPSPEPMETSREPIQSYDEDTQAPPKPPTRSAWEIEQPASTPLGLTDIPPLSHQSVSPSSEFVDKSYGDREATFEEAPIERAPSRKSRYSTGFSELPVVREESPVRHESDRHHISRHHDDDANRDSAFVTESPIPPQGTFTDSHEHVRDSGVHLRDVSPPKEVAAPVSSSDDALARLSWPQVDEETETVNINKSLRPKVVSDKHRHEEKSSLSSHDSHKPKEDRDIDFFRAQRPADERPVEHHHHHDETSSRDLLPSQRTKEDSHSDLHRTRTIHKSAEERPKHHHGEAEQHTDLHRTRTIHGSEERPTHHDEELTSRDIRPPHSERDEKYADLHRTKTIHRAQAQDKGNLVKQRVHRLESSEHLRSAKPREEGSVKERVQRLESPDLQRPSKPKEAKYSELNQSQIPKAERPQGIPDTAIAAGTVALAGAGLGFAAARQLSAEKRPNSAASQRSASNINRLRTPDPKFRSESANSHRSSGTPPLRRSDRKISGDLRSLSQRSQLDLAKEAELAALSTSSVNTANPTANEGRVRAKDMADVYVS
jgi:hypothetical protein